MEKIMSAAEVKAVESATKVRLIKDLRFKALSLEQIEAYPDDARPLGMIYNFLRKQMVILASKDGFERDKENAKKYRSLFFLLDADLVQLRSWLMKAKMLIDSGLVQTDEKDAFIMDKLVKVKAFYNTKYSKMA